MRSQLNIPHRVPSKITNRRSQRSSGAGQTMAGKLQIVDFVPLPREGALTVLGPRS